VTKDGSNKVSVWTDQSGNGIKATQPTGTRYPTYVALGQNSWPAMRFTAATSTFLDTGAYPALNTNTVSWLVVGKVISPAANALFVRSNYTSQAQLWSTFYNTADATYRSHARATGGVIRGLGNTTSPGYVTLAGVWDGQTINGYLNGTLGTIPSDWPNGNTGANCAATGHLNFTIGAQFDGAAPLDGEIAEILVFTRTLKDAERQTIERYLQTKYAL
jgi:hypothetical protein